MWMSSPSPHSVDGEGTAGWLFVRYKENLKKKNTDVQTSLHPAGHERYQWLNFSKTMNKTNII